MRDRALVSGRSRVATEVEEKPAYKTHISKDSSWHPHPNTTHVPACGAKGWGQTVNWRDLLRVDCKRCRKTGAYLAASMNWQENEA